MEFSELHPYVAVVVGIDNNEFFGCRNYERLVELSMEMWRAANNQLLAALSVSWLAVATLFVASNWVYRYEVLASTRGVSTRISDASASLFAGYAKQMGPVDRYRGGVPLTYYNAIRYADGEVLARLNWLKLVANLISFGGLLVAVLLYEHKTRFQRGKPASGSEASRNKRGILLSDIFIGTAAVASVFGYWQLLEARAAHAKRLGDRLNRTRSTVIMHVSLPQPFARFIPSELYGSFLRIGQVAATASVDDELLGEVVRQPNLTQLQTYGTLCNAEHFEQLQQNGTLDLLSIYGAPIDQATLDQICSLKSLRILELTGLELDVPNLAPLDRLTRLVGLSLQDSNAKLADISALKSSKHLQTLTIPRPGLGETAAVSIHGMPSLRLLACHSLVLPHNEAPVDIVFHDLPSLERIELDVLQAWNLEIVNTPKLQMLFSNSAGEVNRDTREHKNLFLDIRSLKLAGPTQLKELAVFGKVNSVEIADNPQLIFGVSVGCFASKVSDGAGGFIQNTDYLGAEYFPLETRQNWLDLLSQSTQLRNIDYSYLPLEQTDLTPILDCQETEFLDLSYSNISYDQLAALKDLPRIVDLRIEDLPASNQIIRDLTKRFPTLRKLELDMSQLNRPKLEDIPKLARLSPHRDFFFASVDALHLDDLPNFEMAYEFAPDLKHLHISGCPKISGLSFQGPLPQAYVLEDLEMLKFFAAGGPQLDDDLLGKILVSSETLTNLTVAFASATPETLNRISECHNLRWLTLTGSAVDNEVIEAWDFDGLQHLQALRLENTGVTAAILGRLATLPSLLRLSLSDCNDEGLEAEDLTALKGLMRLDLQGFSLNAEHIRAFAAMTELHTLNLTGCQVPPEFLKILDESLPKTCKYLILTGVKLDPADFPKFFESHGIKVDFWETDLPGEVVNKYATWSRAITWRSESLMAPAAPMVMIKPIIDEASVLPETDGYRYIGSINPWVFDPNLQANNSTATAREGFSEPEMFDEMLVEPRSGFGQFLEMLKEQTFPPK